MERLPRPFRGHLTACERHAAAPPLERWTTEGFCAMVGEDLGRSPDAAEAAARAVFAALRAQLTEDEAEEIDRRLPHELQPLWRRVS